MVFIKTLQAHFQADDKAYFLSANALSSKKPTIQLTQVGRKNEGVWLFTQILRITV